jgi:hypothetical protein
VGISVIANRSHMLRKIMLGKVIAELLKEIGESCGNLTLLERRSGAKKQTDELKNSLSSIRDRVKKLNLKNMKSPFSRSNHSPYLSIIASQAKSNKRTCTIKNT